MREIIFIVISLVFFVSCGQSKCKNCVNPGKVLAGKTLESNCIPDGDSSVKYQLIISERKVDGSFDMNLKLFGYSPSAICEDDLNMSVNVSSNNFIEKVLNKEGDFFSRRTLIQSSLAVHNPDIVDGFNNFSAYGYNNWEINVPQDVTGLGDCNLNDIPCFPEPAGSVLYSTNWLSVNEQGKYVLTLSEEDETNNGSSVDLRTRVKSTNLIFTEI